MEDISSWDITEFCVVGDLHANLSAVSRVLTGMAGTGCATLISVGDLGVAWAGDAGRVVCELDRLLDAAGVKLLFIDGNHEGWPYLNEVRAGTRGGAHQLGEHVTWADRGARWEWSGVRFGSLGGAYSIGSNPEWLNVTWWPEDEAPTEEEVDVLCEGGRCDVLITHDAPLETPLLSRWPEHSESEVTARKVRALLSDAVRRTDTHTVFHGHWHHRHDTMVRIAGSNVRVVGLGWDQGPGDGLWTKVVVDQLSAAANAAGRAVAQPCEAKHTACT